jgi:HAD superfamily hydrolase (TIGR01509 family)
MTIKGLIFDFDGLIIDTEESIFQSWQELYQSYGFDIPMQKWLTTIGTVETDFDPTEELNQLVGYRLDWETIEPVRRQRELDLINDLPPLPGVAEILSDAKLTSLKVGLASSATCDWVTMHLKRLGFIHYFDCLIASDDVHRTKPDPALFQSALAALELQPEQAVVFEDSPNGLLAARRAKIFSVAVPGKLTRELPLDDADLRLYSLSDLPLRQLLDLIEERQKNCQVN